MKKELGFCWILGLTFSLFACGQNNSTSSTSTSVNLPGEMLHLAFDEGKGREVHDSTGHVESATCSFALSTSPSLENKPDLAWKSHGVQQGALLFDGYSTWISYPSSSFLVKGTSFSISSWIAPRAFDWDDRDAIANDTEYLTGIASQFYKDPSFSAGFVFGYHRDGSFTFQCGNGSEWWEIWDEGMPLKKYQWNQIGAVFDGDNGEMFLYLNGKIINKKAIPLHSAIEGADLPLYIGKSSNTKSSGGCSQGVVSGLLDEVVFSDQVWSNSTVRNYYSSLTPNGVPEVAFSDVWLQNELTEDLYKTQFHGGPYEHWMNEPHAPIYYKGIYHLFFQFNIQGPYFNEASGIAWGHLVSPDMITWKPIKEAIVPRLGSVCPDGCWSGGSTYATVNGIEDVPVLLFTAGDYHHEGLLSNQNIGLATPKDPSDPYLTEWEVSPQLAIEQKQGQGQPNEFRDASVFIEGDTYYLVCASSLGNRGCALLYTADRKAKDPLHHWTYRGVLYDYPAQEAKDGTTWELPVLLPLSDKEGRATGKYILIISPAPATTADNNIVYWVGSFDKAAYRFVPDQIGEPTRMDYGYHVFTGPSGFVDPVSGFTTLFSIMQDQSESSFKAACGWANCVGLARRLSYEDGELRVRPIPALESLGEEIVRQENCSLSESNTALAEVKSNQYRLSCTFSDFAASEEFGFRLRISANREEYTRIYLQPKAGLIGSDTQLNLNGSAAANGEYHGSLALLSSVSVDVFVDRSLIEVFFAGEKTICCRSYPQDLHANSLELYSKGSEPHIESLSLAKIGGIYEA